MSTNHDGLALFGHDLFGDPVVPPSAGPLADRFVVPPFSVLDARAGYWQERKAAWLGLGIESEVGRSAESFNSQDRLLERQQTGDSRTQPHHKLAATALSQKLAPGGGGGGCWLGGPKTASTERFHTASSGRAMELAGGESASQQSGTSVFDPVLCELAYRWFCPEGGTVLDPFAGGSVRGLLAGLLGLHYHGIELRPEQVAANEVQRARIAPEARVEWRTGDSMDLLPTAPEADFLFSCPPYGDLEVYSDDPRDLSTMEYHTFVAAYRRVILRAASRLRPNRFACFVVGDYRDRRTGNYRGFVVDTITAFREVGLELYNDAVFVTPCGSLPVRIGKQFEAGRKLGKTHQNVLVFVKGDARKAAAACRASAAA